MAEEISPRVNRGGHPERHRQEGSKSEGEKPNGKTREEAKRQAKSNKEQETRDKRQEEAEEVAKEAEKRIEEAKANGEQKKIVFSQAKDSLKIVSTLQDETQIIINPEELKNFKSLLINYGHLKASEIEKLTPEQIVVVFQIVARKVGFEEPKEEDFAYKGDVPNRGLEESRVKSLIRQAESPDEETLTVEKVEQYLGVEEFESLPERGGPGTTEAPGPVETQIENVRETIARMKLLTRMGRNVSGDHDWDDYSGRLHEAIQEFNVACAERRFLRVYDFMEVLDDAVYTAENYEPPMPGGRPAIDILNSFLSSADRDRFRAEKDRLDREFERVYMGMDDRTRRIALEDLELALGTQIQGIINGWNRPENVRAYIFGGPYTQYDNEGRVLGQAISGGVVGDMSRDVERSLGADVVGIREWRATKEIYGAEERVSIEILTRPPARWQEVPERITRIYRFIEKSEFTVEQLQSNLQKALQMLESIQTDDREGREILDELNAEFKAFQAFHMFRVTLERGSMMADDNVVGVFRHYFDDETWQNFIKRFGHDSRIREFIGRDREKINLLDEAWNVYLGELQKDRKRMNGVEEMTKRSLDLHTNNIDEMWIILKMVYGKEEAESFDQLILETEADCRREIGRLNPDQLRRLDVWGLDLRQDKSRTQEVVADWYARRTLVGADKQAMEGIATDEAGNRTKYNVDLLEYRREQIREKLKQVLQRKGLVVDGEDNTARLLEELDKQGFLEAVDSNAYNLAWSLAWSDFDIVRIYGIDRKTHKVSKIPQEIAYNKDTRMFYGRHTDHMMDFLVDEERGRGYEQTEINAIFRKHLLGEHGNLLPQNRIMVRFARLFMTPQQQAEVERRAQALMKRHDFVPDESYRKLLERDLVREREEHPENAKRDPYFEGFLGWARSAAIAEMIDSGDLGDENAFSFANQGFSKVAKSIGQFEMIDLYSDRKAALNYFSREKLQGYLRDPSDERFLAINDKDQDFYSGRNMRLWPWMNLAFRIHWEISHKYRKKLFDRDNLQSGGGENLVIQLIDNGVIKKEQGNYLKRELFGVGKGIFGTTPFRRARQYADVVMYGVWETVKSPGFWGSSIFDFFKRAFVYAFGGLNGK